jgi:hypothetical protein
VATSELDATGGFALAVPRGLRYRIEVVTRDGAHGFVAHRGAQVRPIAFDVCRVEPDFDFGHVHGWGEGSTGEHDCGMPDEPVECDPQTGIGCEPCRPGPDNDCVDPGTVCPDGLVEVGGYCCDPEDPT